MRQVKYKKTWLAAILSKFTQITIIHACSMQNGMETILPRNYTIRAVHAKLVSLFYQSHFKYNLSL